MSQYPQYPPQQYPPPYPQQQQYPPQQYPPQQYPPQPYPPQYTQYPPQQYPPQQYPSPYPYPAQQPYPPQSYPPQPAPPQPYPPQSPPPSAPAPSQYPLSPSQLPHPTSQYPPVTHYPAPAHPQSLQTPPTPLSPPPATPAPPTSSLPQIIHVPVVQGAPSPQIRTDKISSLQNQFAAILERSHVPALVGMVSLPSENMFVTAGVRKVGSNDPVQYKDYFHIGPNTQAMTATLIAIFVDKGRLSWESNVASFFPDLHVHHDYRNLTVRMLASNHSGITKDVIKFNDGKLWKELRDPNLAPTDGRRKVAYEVLSRPAATTPDKSGLSLFNYTILGAILEKISGYPWEVVINAELFVPLGMTTCGFGSPSQFPDQPWGHKPGKHQPFESELPHDNPIATFPAAGIHCALADWAKFLRYHIDGYNGKPVIPRVNFSILHQPIPGDSVSCGAWRIKEGWGGPTLSYIGNNTMYYAQVFMAPKKETAVFVVANAGGEAAKDAVTDGLKAILESMT